MESSKIMPESSRQAAGAEDSLAIDGFVDVGFAAQYLALSRAKVYQLMESGDLKFAKFGRSRRIPRLALLRYAESRLTK